MHTSDDIHVYREGELTYVLSENPRLGYVGLEVYQGDETTGDLFLQGDEVIQVLGREGLSPPCLIRRLADCIY